MFRGLFYFFIITFPLVANEVELIEFSDLRLRNQTKSAPSLFKTWSVLGEPALRTKMSLKIEQSRISGFDGCAEFSSSLRLDKSSFTIAPLHYTVSNCKSVSGADIQFRKLLNRVTEYRITSDGILELLSSDRSVLLRLL